MEQSVGANGAAVPRARGHAGAGRTAPGDVVVRCRNVGRDGMDMYLDVRVKGAASAGAAGGVAAKEAYDEKLEEHNVLCRKGFKTGATDAEKIDGQRRAGIDFQPIGMDGWGCMDGRSFQALEGLMGSAARAVSVGMARAVVLSQAVADHNVRTRMRVAEAQRASQGHVSGGKAVGVPGLKDARRLRAAKRGRWRGQAIDVSDGEGGCGSQAGSIGCDPGTGMEATSRTAETPGRPATGDGVSAGVMPRRVVMNAPAFIRWLSCAMLKRDQPGFAGRRMYGSDLCRACQLSLRDASDGCGPAEAWSAWRGNGPRAAGLRGLCPACTGRV